MFLIQSNGNTNTSLKCIQNGLNFIFVCDKLCKMTNLGTIIDSKTLSQSIGSNTVTRTSTLHLVKLQLHSRGRALVYVARESFMMCPILVFFKLLLKY